jgi:hypothetical protein
MRQGPRDCLTGHPFRRPVSAATNGGRSGVPRSRTLKVRRSRGRDRRHIVAKEVGIVFGANLLAHRALLDATIVLIRRPGRGESARILDARFGFDRLSALGYAVTLDDMELFGVWGLVAVDKGLRIQPDRIDHQRIAVLIAAENASRLLEDAMLQRLSRRRITRLAADIALLDKRLIEIVTANPTLDRRYRLLTSMPGVGAVLACS